MSEPSTAWLALMEFFEPKIGTPVVGRNKLTRNTDLPHDLDMEPEQIGQVLREWASRFNVDLIEFDLDHCYPANQLGTKAFLLTVLKTPFSRQARETLGGWQLTLGMLEDAMQKGKLDRPWALPKK